MTSAAVEQIERPIQEIVGIYASNEEIDIALSDLLSAGIDASQTGLIAHRDTVSSQLQEIYRESPVHSLSPSIQIDFVGQRTDHSQLASQFGALGSAGGSSDGDIVASRSILVEAARAATGGNPSMFPTGLTALNRLPDTHSQSINFEEPLINALEDERLLLCISGRDNSKVLAAKLALDFSDSIDEGILEIETRQLAA